MQYIIKYKIKYKTAWCLDLQNQQKYCDFILLLCICLRIYDLRVIARGILGIFIIIIIHYNWRNC